MTLRPFFWKASRTWVGVRWTRGGRYYFARRKHRQLLSEPLVSERYGYKPVRVFFRVGAWEFCSK